MEEQEFLSSIQKNVADLRLAKRDFDEQFHKTMESSRAIEELAQELTKKLLSKEE